MVNTSYVYSKNRIRYRHDGSKSKSGKNVYISEMNGLWRQVTRFTKKNAMHNGRQRYSQPPTPTIQTCTHFKDFTNYR